MNIKIIFLAFIFCGAYYNVLAVEKSQAEKASTPLTTKSVLKPMGNKYFWLGAHATTLTLMGSGTTVGVGVNAMFSINGDKQAYFVDFSYYFPFQSQNEELIYAVAAGVDPWQRKINVDYKISGKSARLGYRVYFLKNLVDDGFRPYLHAFTGVQFINVTSTAESYNKDDYAPQYIPAYNATALILGGGFGGEYSMGSKLNVFGDVNLNLPATIIGPNSSAPEVPLAMKLTLGTKFLF